MTDTTIDKLLTALDEIKGMCWGSVQMDGDYAAKKIQQAAEALRTLTEQPTYLVGTLVWVPVWQAKGIIVDIDDTGKSYGVKFDAPDELPAGTEWFGAESLRLDTSEISALTTKLEQTEEELDAVLRWFCVEHREILEFQTLQQVEEERDENKRLYMTSLRNVQTSVAHAADLNAQLEDYQEKARALHKYLGDKNVDGIEAVITEFSLMAERSCPPETSE